MSERGSASYWAHVLWQRHGVPMDVYLAWPRLKQAAYIASELLEGESPVRQANFMMGGGGGHGGFVGHVKGRG